MDVDEVNHSNSNLTIESEKSEVNFCTFSMGLMAVLCVQASVTKVIRFVEADSREGMPLRKAEHTFYLDWVVYSFRITNCVVQDTTQIHT